eukprot:8675788-Ditylum_brightwellii.AAC.1
MPAVKSSNDYAQKRKMLQPELKLWETNASYLFDAAFIYHLLVIIFYMGMIKLQCKSDYWRTNNP